MRNPQFSQQQCRSNNAHMEMLQSSRVPRSSGEGVLFPALRRVKLIPEEAQAEVASLAYSRCGRTDKGVSALGQVLALRLRSSALAGQPLPPAAAELDYPSLLNKALPDTIRVLGWADAAPEFSARFDCRDRKYKYFMVQDGGLDLAAMNAAAQHLVGEHDFRNFCKADVAQVKNFRREVLAATIEPAAVRCPGMSVVALRIKGTAFLWHQARARLMAEVMTDGRMSHYSELYQPCPVEEFLSKELGVWSYNVMLFAVANPALQVFDLESQVRPAVRSLKAANIDVTDIWFVITKHLEILTEPIALQRWLDFLSLQALDSRHMANFLLKAPDALFTSCTQAQALQVLGWLKALGVKQEYLFPRVLCPCPTILLQDVTTHLQPIVSHLTSLGLEPQHVSRMACVHPELLLISVDAQLQPLVSYLEGLGCSTCQVARLLLEVPQALGGRPPQALFGARVEALRQLGVDAPTLRQMTGRSTAWLTMQGAPAEQISHLRQEMGFSTEQVRALVTACPAILSEKPLELQRKADFLTATLNMERGDCLAHPGYLGASLMQVIGPRHAFAVSKGLEAKLQSPGAACSSSNVRSKGGAWGWDLSLLVAGEDVDFADALGASVNEYEGFRTAFEEEYTAQLSKDAAREFQEELKKLGIYEGA
ncbi:hypothetical protein OEZ86_008322 [Tetradesmus obliquus]|nr:hypothetical protein OEZ86_008322 [Tetradesmus obliquus]